MRTAIQITVILASACLSACMTMPEQAEIEQGMEFHLAELKKNDNERKNNFHAGMAIKASLYHEQSKEHLKALLYLMYYYYGKFGETPKIQEIEKEFFNLMEDKRKEKEEWDNR